MKIPIANIPVEEAVDRVCLVGSAVFGLMGCWSIVDRDWTGAIDNLIGFLVLITIFTLNGLLQKYRQKED